MIPTNVFLPLKDGSSYYPDPEELEMWQKAYPSIDLVQAFREMYSWLKSNPRKMKTRRGIRKFVNSWLSRGYKKPDTSRKTGEIDFFELHSDTSWADGFE